MCDRSASPQDQAAPATAPASAPTMVTLNINGDDRTLLIEPHWTLLYVLRDRLGLTGTKEACGEGACGACTVLVDDIPVLSCLMLAIEQTGKKIETIEGLARGDKLHPLQEAWLEEYGAQCGFCSPGMIMSAKGYLQNHLKADVAAIKEAMGGNVCICGNYEHILAALLKGRQRMLEDGEHG
ncbi:(2Fe-2S)-binding protein [Deltaproteobacteria bacterium OttesenSCG-928-M10]|nr:(2Fe-2S)-binding protein [Deltaproteobacteria bacterium OttesenSCG-928-M10]